MCQAEMSVNWKKVAHGLTTKKSPREVEAYNWVVSICLKYVSLPWHMVNSPRRGASEPWAWREFYKHPDSSTVNHATLIFMYLWNGQ